MSKQELEGFLRDWSLKMDEMDIELYLEEIYGEEFDELARAEGRNISDSIEGVESGRERGRKDGYYRTRFMSVLPVLAEYLGKNSEKEMFGSAEKSGVSKKMLYGLEHSKVFCPSDDLFELLRMTDTSEEMMANPPYPNTFISKIWDAGEMVLFGALMVTAVKEDVYREERWDGELKPLRVSADHPNYDKMPDRMFVAYVSGWSAEHDEMFFAEMHVPVEDSPHSGIEDLVLVRGGEYPDWMTEEIKEYAMTVKKLFHFLNTPNVEYVKRRERELTDKGNMRRLRRGKQPSPSHSVVTVDGQTRRYIEDVRESEGSIKSQHWVRGHFRVLRDEDYWGSRAGEKVWVRPHLRGHGDLIDQEYEVEAGRMEADV